MSVRITKEGFRRFEWNGTLREYVEEPFGCYAARLRDACAVDLGVTLGDIFKAVESDAALKPFLCLYSSCDVNAFHAEAKRQTVRRSELAAIELSSFFDPEEGFRIDVYGLDKDGQNKAIDFTPVNELAHLEVRLNTKCAVMGPGLVKLYEADVTYSLLDVLGEIYWEISFLGTPAQRDEKAAELLQIIKEVESGEAELTPLEEIRKPVVN